MTHPVPVSSSAPPPVPGPVGLPPSRPGPPRWMWILLILLTAVVVGGVAGLLAHADGASPPAAILTGGAAFAGTVGLLLALAHYADGGRS